MDCPCLPAPRILPSSVPCILRDLPTLRHHRILLFSGIQKLTQCFHVPCFYLPFSFPPCCEMPQADFLPQFHFPICALRYQTLPSASAGEVSHCRSWRAPCLFWSACLYLWGAPWVGLVRRHSWAFLFPPVLIRVLSASLSRVHSRCSGDVYFLSEFPFILLPSLGVPSSGLFSTCLVLFVYLKRVHLVSAIKAFFVCVYAAPLNWYLMPLTCGLVGSLRDRWQCQWHSPLPSFSDSPNHRLCVFSTSLYFLHCTSVFWGFCILCSALKFFCIFSCISHIGVNSISSYLDYLESYWKGHSLFVWDLRLILSLDWQDKPVTVLLKGNLNSPLLECDAMLPIRINVLCFPRLVKCQISKCLPFRLSLSLSFACTLLAQIIYLPSLIVVKNKVYHCSHF